jgi:hypothetical protein
MSNAYPPVSELDVPTNAVHNDETVSDVTDVNGLNGFVIPDDNTIIDFDVTANTIVNALAPLPTATTATTVPTTATTTLPITATTVPTTATTTLPTTATTVPTTATTTLPTTATTVPGTGDAHGNGDEQFYEPIDDDDHSNGNVPESVTTSVTSQRKRKETKAYLYCATWNNYDDDTIEYVSSWKYNPKVKYANVHYEVGDSGTPHLQIVVQFVNPLVLGLPWHNKDTGKWSKRKGACAFFSLSKKKANGTDNCANVLVAKGDLYTNWMYCSKGEQTKAERKGRNKNDPNRGFGRNAKPLLLHPEGFTPKPGINGRQGVRSKIVAQDPKEPVKRPINCIEEFRTRAKELIQQVRDGDGKLKVIETLLEEYPEMEYDRPGYIRNEVKRLKKVDKVKCVIESNEQLNPAQKMIFELVSEWPRKNDRNVRFLVDTRGSAGKTQLKKFLQNTAPNFFAYIRPGKKADLATQLQGQMEDKSVRLVILDCPRCKGNKGEGIPFDLLEELLDCELSVVKYKSILEDLDDVPHVCVFTNSEPDYTLLSVDRYTVHLIKPGQKIVTKGPRYALEKFIEVKGREQADELMGVDFVNAWLSLPVECEQMPPDVEADVRRKEEERNAREESAVFNLHVGDSDKENSQYHKDVVEEQRKQHAQRFELKRTSQSLNLLEIRPLGVNGPPAHHESIEAANNRKRKKARTLTPKPVNEGFLREFN